MVSTPMPDPIECEFCEEEIEPNPPMGFKGRREKLKMNDSTRKEGWLCNDCNPKVEE